MAPWGVRLQEWIPNFSAPIADQATTAPRMRAWDTVFCAWNVPSKSTLSPIKPGESYSTWTDRTIRRSRRDIDFPASFRRSRGSTIDRSRALGASKKERRAGDESVLGRAPVLALERFGESPLKVCGDFRPDFGQFAPIRFEQLEGVRTSQRFSDQCNSALVVRTLLHRLLLPKYRRATRLLPKLRLSTRSAPQGTFFA